MRTCPSSTCTTRIIYTCYYVCWDSRTPCPRSLLRSSTNCRSPAESTQRAQEVEPS